MQGSAWVGAVPVRSCGARRAQTKVTRCGEPRVRHGGHGASRVHGVGPAPRVVSGRVTNTSAPEEIDVLVIGSGAGGGVAALEIARSGRTVVLVEMGRVGGECHYVSCVPSKALLIAAREGVTWDEALRRRDEAADGRSDSAAVREHEKAGVQIVRGTARVTGDHDVAITFDEKGERVFRWAKALVLAPGSEPVIPRVPGLALEMTWTSEQALSSDELPSDLLVMGGGAVGCEMAQIYAAFGTQVTLVEKTERLLAGEQPWVGELVAANLRASGVDVRAGVEATPGRAPRERTRGVL
jgi:pyruvate/2-oxoglutarate dehydrogenase complex dihydrolipoamide dehydrogenase (E3) component